MIKKNILLTHATNNYLVGQKMNIIPMSTTFQSSKSATKELTQIKIHNNKEKVNHAQ